MSFYQQQPPGLYQQPPPQTMQPPQQQQQGFGQFYGQQPQAMQMQHHHQFQMMQHQQQFQQLQQPQMMPPQQQPLQQQQQGPLGLNIPVPVLDSASQKREDDLRSWFAAVDQRNTGRIDAEELRAALSSSGSEFKASTAERLIRMFDKDNNNSISFQEFRAAHDFISSMASGFRSRDTDKSGTLEGPEVKEALALSGYNLSQPAFDLLLRKFGKSRGHSAAPPSLDFASYIDLSIMLGSSARVFGFYDRNRSGLVTFDFNTFFVALLASTI
jgi:Ca2+-binding EF-hand superfamily protein